MSCEPSRLLFANITTLFTNMSFALTMHPVNVSLYTLFLTWTNTAHATRPFLVFYYLGAFCNITSIELMGKKVRAKDVNNVDLTYIYSIGCSGFPNWWWHEDTVGTVVRWPCWVCGSICVEDYAQHQCVFSSWRQSWFVGPLVACVGWGRSSLGFRI